MTSIQTTEIFDTWFDGLKIGKRGRGFRRVSTVRRMEILAIANRLAKAFPKCAFTMVPVIECISGRSVLKW